MFVLIVARVTTRIQLKIKKNYAIKSREPSPEKRQRDNP